MYDDYEVVYESNINENLTLWIVVGIIVAIIALITLISLSRIFKKANRSGISAFIPFYNTLILLEIANMPKSYFIPMLIPVVNIPFLLNVNIKVANLFKKTKMFGMGMAFLPFIYYPILAFSSSEYAGINLSGMNSKVSEAIPVIDDTKNQEKDVQVNEEMESSVNLSTGVGKLGNTEKKDVDFDKLLKVEEKKEEPQDTPIDPTVGATLKTSDDIYTVSYIETEQGQQPTNLEQPVVEPVPDVLASQPVIEGINPELTAQPVVDLPTPDVQPQQTPIQPSTGKVDLLASNTVAPGQDGYRLCPNCGTRALDGAEMCMICGAKLN